MHRKDLLPEDYLFFPLHYHHHERHQEQPSLLLNSLSLSSISYSSVQTQSLVAAAKLAVDGASVASVQLIYSLTTFFFFSLPSTALSLLCLVKVR